MHASWRIAVHVQHRRFDHLGHVAAVRRGARVLRVAGGKADLIVDNQVDRAPGCERTGLRELQRFRHDALPRHRGVAVDQHRQDLVPLAVATPVHARAHGPQHHGIDDFQVRGIERKHHVHQAARRGDVGRKAHVVLHVTVLAGKRFGLAGKLRVEFLRRLSKHVYQDVDPPPVGHADHDFLQALGPGLLDQVVEHRNQAVAAFQREALLPHVARVQVTLQALGGDELPQDRALDRVRRTPGQLCRLHPVAQP